MAWLVKSGAFHVIVPSLAAPQTPLNARLNAVNVNVVALSVRPVWPNTRMNRGSRSRCQKAPQGRV